jgi:hypothetical protein
MEPATYRLSSAQRARIAFLAEELGKGESELAREAFADLSVKYAAVLKKRFNPEALLERVKQNIDRTTLDKIHPELLALGPQDYSGTLEKVQTLLSERVSRLVLEHKRNAKLTSPLLLSWSETTLEAADRIIKILGDESSASSRNKDFHDL